MFCFAHLFLTRTFLQVKSFSMPQCLALQIHAELFWLRRLGHRRIFAFWRL